MDREALAKRLMATFLDEHDELVRAIGRDVLALEHAAGAERTELVRSLFRSAHSLKGAARTVNVRVVEVACHGLETILVKARDGDQTLSPAVVELVLAAVDAMTDAAGLLREGRPLEGSSLDALLPKIEQVVARSAPAPSGATRDAKAARDTAAASDATPKSIPDSTDASVRVRAEKLDALLAHSGELLVARGRLDGRVHDVAALLNLVDRWEGDFRSIEKPMRRLLHDRPRAAAPRAAGHGTGKAYSGPRRVELALARMNQNFRRIRKDIERIMAAMAHDTRVIRLAAAPLEEQVRRVRMLPFAEACEGLERVARDVAKMSGKELRLVVEGGDVELNGGSCRGSRRLSSIWCATRPITASRRKRLGAPPASRSAVESRCRRAFEAHRSR